ncbi:MAG: macrocin O-methyltransferase [Spirochaetales bacterium]|nr:macrocin O-methyltransferase [Spirochaetales bacterium]
MTDPKEEEYAARLRERGWGCESPATFRIDMDDSFKALWETAAPFTMISMERGYAVYSAVKHIVRRKIAGDFVECGVWQGGTCMIMALSLQALGAEDRTIWMYDTYSGMTLPGDEDRIAASGQPVSERWKEGWWAAGMEQVRRNLDSLSYPADRFRMIPGDVCRTLDEDAPEKTALLRLDTDWYASTKKELEVLYPRLEKGGILIIDDYGHFSGARQAVDEYFADDPSAPLFQRSDYTGRMAVNED